MAAVPEAKQSNQNVLSFQLGLCSAIIPPELGAAGILEAPIFPSKIGSGGAHKANRLLARLFFSGLFERLLFFVLGDSQVGFSHHYLREYRSYSYPYSSCFLGACGLGCVALVQKVFTIFKLRFTPDSLNPRP